MFRRLSRAMLGYTFIRNGYEAFRQPEPRAKRAEATIARLRDAAPALPDDTVTVVQANAVAQMVGGAMLAVGLFPRLAALGLAASLVPTTVGGHPFWQEDDPGAAAQQRIHFDKNVAMLGGLLAVAADG